MCHVKSFRKSERKYTILNFLWKRKRRSKNIFIHDDIHDCQFEFRTEIGYYLIWFVLQWTIGENIRSMLDRSRI